MRRLLSRPFILLLTLIWCLSATGAFAAPLKAGVDYLPPHCEAIQETGLRVELNRTIQDFFLDETAFDFAALVDRQWQVLQMDMAIDTAIDQAVAMVAADAGAINRLKSSWVPSKAADLADQVTAIAFRSRGLTDKLTQLSNHVASDLSDKLETVSARSSAYALDCLQQFIGRQYSQTFVEVFGTTIEASVPDAADTLATLQPETTTFLKTHAFAFGGVAALVTARITKQIANGISKRVLQQVGERLLGRLGTSIVPLVGEVVGGGLLVYDFINSFDGALPDIQTALKAPVVKTALQQAIAQTIETELRADSLQIAREISNGVYAEWLDFQRQYRETLTLAGDLPEFRDLLAQEPDLSKVYRLVGAALNQMGRTQLMEAIQAGSFARALALPESTYTILETTHSLAGLVDWANLAGNRVEEVAHTELYKHLSPQDLDRPLLLSLLSLKDASTIAKLSLLEPVAIRQLLTLSVPDLLALSAHLSSEDLQRLACYLGDLRPSQANQLVLFLLNRDGAILQQPNVMAHIIQSRDIHAALQFWEAPLNGFSVLDSLRQLTRGTISWHLWPDKLGWGVIALILGLPLLLIGTVAISMGMKCVRFWIGLFRSKSGPQNS
jgi:hypothetical protein